MRFLSQVGRMMIIPILPLFIVSLMPASARVNTFTGLVIGVASATTAVSVVFLGRLGDRVGHRQVLVPSAMTVALLYVIQTMVSAGWQLLALQALVGVAMGGILPTLSALLAGYSRPGQEGAVYGLDHSISAGGRALAPVIGAAVAMPFTAQATFAATAAIFLLAGMFALWQLPEPRKEQQPRLV
jgi:DHA1 family multidrug resistance protein-like MFS transporter